MDAEGKGVPDFNRLLSAVSSVSRQRHRTQLGLADQNNGHEDEDHRNDSHEELGWEQREKLSPFRHHKSLLHGE
jgi:hypothetical protein